MKASPEATTLTHCTTSALAYSIRGGFCQEDAVYPFLVPANWTHSGPGSAASGKYQLELAKLPRIAYVLLPIPDVR